MKNSDKTKLRKAIANKNTLDLLWAYISAATDDLSSDEPSIFKVTDVTNFIHSVIQIEKINSNKPVEPNKNAEEDELVEWSKKLTMEKNL